ncbi:glycoside hydrolase family 43 protein [Bacteroides sp.]
MRKVVAILICVLCICSVKGQELSKVRFGDPFILLHEGVYYAYGTSVKGSNNDGIKVYVSDDLKVWHAPEGLPEGYALQEKDVWGESRFWAPEVYNVGGKFYMYYSADEHICVATSDSPLGPFKQKEKKPMIASEKGIDNSLFIDDDGTPYLFFVRFNDGNAIWVAELEKDLQTVKEETMHSCLHVSQEWEQVWPRVNEGPFVVKHKGIYYMTYSGNSFESPFYGVGCATAIDIMGEWSKYPENPLLQKPGELVGVGHNAMFVDKEGNLRIVYHAHNNKEQIHPRAMHIGYVRFKEQAGVDRMTIGTDYLTPVISE